MTLPRFIEAFDAPTGSDEPRGILYQIRGNVTNNKITNFVVPTAYGASSASGAWAYRLYSPIKWTDAWQGQESTGYYQIEFKDRFVFPTSYSLKGKSGASYGKEWDLYGFNSGETPVLLSSDTTDGSTYCGSCSNDWGTFKIKNPPKKAYRFFRFNHPKYRNFLSAGVEFFGIFSTNGVKVKMKKSRRYKSIPLKFRFQSPLLVMIVICVS